MSDGRRGGLAHPCGLRVFREHVADLGRLLARTFGLLQARVRSTIVSERIGGPHEANPVVDARADSGVFETRSTLLSREAERLSSRPGQAVSAAVALAFLLLVWTGVSHGSSTEIGILVRPFQGEGLDADKAWIPRAVTFLLQSSLEKIQGVDVIAVEQESLRRGDYVITGALSTTPAGLVCDTRIARADGNRPLREITVTEKGAKPDLFVIIGKVYSSLKEELAKAGRATSWPGSLEYQTLSLYALKYYIEAGLPGEEKRRMVLYQRALSLDPKLIEAWLGLAEEHLLLGEVDEAGISINKALLLNPGHPEGNNLLGKMHLRKGDREAAEACFRKAAHADPHLMDAWRNLGRLLRESGREEEAREVNLAARRAFGADGGVMPEALFSAPAIDAGAGAADQRSRKEKAAGPRESGTTADSRAAAQTRAIGLTKSVNDSGPKPPANEEPSFRVANLERLLAERDRQIVILQAGAARVEDLEGRLEKANELAAETSQLKKTLRQASEELEGEARRRAAAEASSRELQSRVEELERFEARRLGLEKQLLERNEELRSLQRELEGLKKREAESLAAKAKLVEWLTRKVAQLSEELRLQSAEVEKLRSAASSGEDSGTTLGMKMDGGTPR